MKRREGESFEDYKARRKAANAETEAKLRRGFWVHKNGANEQPYGELPPNAARQYTRRGHQAAANQRVGKQILLAWISQFLRTPEAV